MAPSRGGSARYGTWLLDLCARISAAGFLQQGMGVLGLHWQLPKGNGHSLLSDVSRVQLETCRGVAAGAVDANTGCEHWVG
jgi:hypothetical protein